MRSPLADAYPVVFFRSFPSRPFFFFVLHIQRLPEKQTHVLRDSSNSRKGPPFESLTPGWRPHSPNHATLMSVSLRLSHPLRSEICLIPRHFRTRFLRRFALRCAGPGLCLPCFSFQLGSGSPALSSVAFGPPTHRARAAFVPLGPGALPVVRGPFQHQSRFTVPQGAIRCQTPSAILWYNRLFLGPPSTRFCFSTGSSVIFLCQTPMFPPNEGLRQWGSDGMRLSPQPERMGAPQFSFSPPPPVTRVPFLQGEGPPRPSNETPRARTGHVLTFGSSPDARSVAQLLVPLFGSHFLSTLFTSVEFFFRTFQRSPPPFPHCR